jgi:hypothetical protein
VVGSYGSTGNVVIDAGDVDETRRPLGTATGRAWVVMGSERLAAGFSALAAMPPAEAHLDTGAGDARTCVRRRGSARSNDLAVLDRLSNDIVAVWKLVLLDGSRLDRDRRRGGFHRHWEAGRRPMDGS